MFWLWLSARNYRLSTRDLFLLVVMISYLSMLLAEVARFTFCRYCKVVVLCSLFTLVPELPVVCPSGSADATKFSIVF